MGVDRPDDAGALAAVAAASAQLLHIRTREEAVEILLRTVSELGGWTVPARDEDDHALPLDLSLGTGEAIVPAAVPGSPQRAELERRLPALVEGARRAVDLVRNLEQLTQDAAVDPLTGLANRRGVRRALSRLGPSTTVIVLDLDGFKQVNDLRGHAAGDEVLRAFARCLRAHARADDLQGRLGGDEFVVVLADTDQDGAAAFLTRLRRSWISQRRHPVGFSAGIATIAETYDDALERADAALYAAKAAGKDTWVRAEDDT